MVSVMDRWRELPNWCEPRLATQPTPGRVSRLPQIAGLAQRLGIPLMPWQAYAIRVGTEIDESGLPAYRDVLVTAGRRAGKTIISFLVMLDRCLQQGPRKIVVHTAQGLTDLTESWEEELDPIITESGLGAVAKYKGSFGSFKPRVIFRANGSRINLLSASGKTGHGKKTDLVVFDEAWTILDATREQALKPTLRTVPDAQTWTISTEGNDRSWYLSTKIDRYSERLLSGQPTMSCILTWGADENADIEDPAVWAKSVPSWGINVGPREIQHEFNEFDNKADFARAVLNIRQGQEQTAAISASAWNAVVGEAKDLAGDIWLGADATPERDRAIIVASDGAAVEVVEARNGVLWINDFLDQLAAKNADVVGVVTAARGPLGGLIDRNVGGLRLIELTATEVADACTNFYDAVIAESISVLRHHELDAARRVSTVLPRSGKWVWGRVDSTTNVSPMYAATFALEGARNRQDSIGFWVGGLDQFSYRDTRE